MDQLTRYAKDLSRIYKAEKEKRKELQAANVQLDQYARDLSRTVKELRGANRDLKDAYLDTIHRLVLAAEFKDEDTGDHLQRMSRYCAMVAAKAGLDAKEVETILIASPMHDVGKIGIPDRILLKPGKLTDDEFAVMKRHTVIGGRILAGAKAEILRVAERIVMSHHEKWDGSGYPGGLKGKNIPLEGRITAIADTFDALSSKRPYKDPYPPDVALDIMEKGKGQHFDPDLTDIFLDNFEEILRIKAEVDQNVDTGAGSYALSERDLEERGSNE